MCRTVRLTTICPRCMNPYTTRENEDLEPLTIQEPETIMCSYASEMRQICASAMIDTYDDGTRHPIPEFDRLGEDFCHSCVSRLRLHINTLPTPLPRSPRWSTSYIDWTPQTPPETSRDPAEKAATPTTPDLIKGGIDYLGFPIQNRKGQNPNIWIDVLDGNHIMAVPDRVEKRNKSMRSIKESVCKKRYKKDGKRIKNKRTPIRKTVRNSSKKADQKIEKAALSSTDTGPKESMKGILRDVANSEQTTSRQASKRVHFDEVTQKPTKTGVNCVNKKKGTRTSIPRKAKKQL